jgi:hypothetical protein
MSQLRSYESLSSELQKQIRFLNNSSKLFDEGEEDEAVRLATTIRVLFHDTYSSTSLLKQLNIKDILNLVDTGVYESRYYDTVNEYLKNWGSMEK